MVLCDWWAGYVLDEMREDEMRGEERMDDRMWM